MRKQRPRGSTTRQTIIDAALTIADRDGIDRLTIRSVAAFVNAPPMSLYTHFANKEQLLDLMLEEILRRVCAHEGHSTWQDELRALCHRVRRILTNHPQWTALLSRAGALSSLPLSDDLLSAMAEDGLVPADGVMAVHVAALSSMGLGLAQVSLACASACSSRKDRPEEYRVLGRDAGGAERRDDERCATEARARVDFERVFQFFVDTFIVGIEAKRAHGE